MKIIVVGAGLTGVTSAYYLARLGHDVTVIESRAGPARGASYSNGGLLTPSMSDPWNAPGCWRTLLKSLWQADSPLQLRLRSLPSLATWGLQFLRNSNEKDYHRSTIINLRLSLFSLSEMELLQRLEELSYGKRSLGSLRLFRDSRSFDGACRSLDQAPVDRVDYRRLSVGALSEMEPALIPIASQLAGAIHYPGDAMGDAYKFCNQLAERAHLLGVRFLYVTAATKLRLADRKVTGLMCDAEEFVADQYVVCAGSWSNVLLRTVGVHLPIRPAKGYSVTLENPPTNVATSLRIPVVDDQLHAVVTPLEGAVRVAGTAEFAGYNVDINPQRVRNLLGLLSKVLPEQPFNLETAKPWCGLRPMTSDGVPLIGRTTIENLWVNSGHGHLGWTMATGSARLLSDLICNKCLPMDAKPYSPARFLQHKRGMNRDFH